MEGGFRVTTKASDPGVSPHRIQAWREVNEMPDRELMCDGRWLV